MENRREGQHICYSLDTTVFAEVMAWVIGPGRGRRGPRHLEGGRSGRSDHGEGSDQCPRDLSRSTYRVDWRKPQQGLACLARPSAPVSSASLMLYPHLPAPCPIHWNLHRGGRGFPGKFWGAIGLPLLNVGICLMLLFLPLVDSKQANYPRFHPVLPGVPGSSWPSSSPVSTAVSPLHGPGRPIDVGLVVTLGVQPSLRVPGQLPGADPPQLLRRIRTPWTLARDGRGLAPDPPAGQERLFVLAGLLPWLAWPFSRAAALSTLIGGRPRGGARHHRLLGGAFPTGSTPGNAGPGGSGIGDEPAVGGSFSGSAMVVLVRTGAAGPGAAEALGDPLAWAVQITDQLRAGRFQEVETTLNLVAGPLKLSLGLSGMFCCWGRVASSDLLRSQLTGSYTMFSGLEIPPLKPKPA